MSSQDGGFLLGGDIPKPKGCVRTARNKVAAVRRKPHALNRPAMSDERASPSSDSKIPENDGAVIPSRCERFSIGRKGGAIDKAFLLGGKGQRGSRRHIPQ